MASVEDLGGGRWRVRWRHKIEGKWKSKEKTIQGSRIQADALKVRVEESIAEHGFFDDLHDRAKHGAPANLLDGLLDFISARRSNEEIGDSTQNAYEDWVRLFALRVHKIKGIPKDEPLPVTILTRDLFDQVKEDMRKENLAPSYRAHIIRVVIEGWLWMTEDPTKYPKVPPAPARKRGWIPAETIYGRTVAPGLDHVDAVLRTLVTPRGAKPVSEGTIAAVLMMRYTGLRISQVLGALRQDLDLASGTLLVRVGKTKQEKADQRIIPVSKHLLAEPLFLAHVEGQAMNGPLIDLACGPARTLRHAWEDSGAPSHVWNPHNRRHARPLHSFRAALIGYFRRRVDADVWKWLVGHKAAMAERHYGSELMTLARQAVDEIPPVRWVVAVQDAQETEAAERLGSRSAETEDSVGKVIPIRVSEPQPASG